jgi:hypothetical protein
MRRLILIIAASAAVIASHLGSPVATEVASKTSGDTIIIKTKWC